LAAANDPHLAALRALAPNVELRTAQNSASAPGSAGVPIAQCASARSTAQR
jgi:hypothetical protein